MKTADRADPPLDAGKEGTEERHPGVGHSGSQCALKLERPSDESQILKTNTASERQAFLAADFGMPKPAPEREFRSLRERVVREDDQRLAGSAPVPLTADEVQSQGDRMVSVSPLHSLSLGSQIRSGVRALMMAVLSLGDGFSQRVGVREWENLFPTLNDGTEKPVMERMRALLNWDPHEAMLGRASSLNQRILNRGDAQIRAMQRAAKRGDQVELEKLYTDWTRSHPAPEKDKEK